MDADEAAWMFLYLPFPLSRTRQQMFGKGSSDRNHRITLTTTLATRVDGVNIPFGEFDTRRRISTVYAAALYPGRGLSLESLQDYTLMSVDPHCHSYWTLDNGSLSHETRDLCGWSYSFLIGNLLTDGLLTGNSQRLLWFCPPKRY